MVLWYTHGKAQVRNQERENYSLHRQGIAGKVQGCCLQEDQVLQGNI